MRENSQINKVKMRLFIQTNNDQHEIGHVPEALTSKLFTSMQEWKIYKVSRAMSGEFQKVWVLGGSTEISYKYFFCEPVIHKTFVRNGL